MRTALAMALRALEQEAALVDRRDLLADIEHAYFILQYVCDQIARVPDMAEALLQDRSPQPEGPTIPDAPAMDVVETN